MPYVGTGCFLFKYALLSPPDNFLRRGGEERGAMTSGCLQLLLAGSGNLSREKFLQRFHRLTPEKVFHELIAEAFRQLHAMCVSPVLCFISC